MCCEVQSQSSDIPDRGAGEDEIRAQLFTSNYLSSLFSSSAKVAPREAAAILLMLR
jgi:hypothetical protein